MKTVLQRIKKKLVKHYQKLSFRRAKFENMFAPLFASDQNPVGLLWTRPDRVDGSH